MTKKEFPPPNYVPIESALEGFTVYQPAEIAEPEQQIQVQFDCPQCGGKTAFNAADGGLTCTYCAYHEKPQEEILGKSATEFEFTTEHVEQAAQGWGVSRKTLSCQSCGAEMNIPADSLTSTCLYCMSNNVIQQKASQDILRPRFIIPFKVDKAQKRAYIQKWLAEGDYGKFRIDVNNKQRKIKMWRITPKELSDFASVDSQFTAIYLPFWTFDARLEVDWNAEVQYERKGLDGKTQRYYQRTSGHEQKRIDDMLLTGSARVDDALIEALADYDLESLVAYAPEYLAGLHAQAYDISLTDGWEKARQRMRSVARAACTQSALKPSKAKGIRNLNMQISFLDESWRYVLLPVYLGVYRYDNKIYQVLVNGQTGTVSGKMPVVWSRVWMHIALFFFPTLILLLGGLVLIPFGIGCIIAPLGLISVVFSTILTQQLVKEAKSLEESSEANEDLGDTHESKK